MSEKQVLWASKIVFKNVETEILDCGSLIVFLNFLSMITPSPLVFFLYSSLSCWAPSLLSLIYMIITCLPSWTILEELLIKKQWVNSTDFQIYLASCPVENKLIVSLWNLLSLIEQTVLPQLWLRILLPPLIIPVLLPLESPTLGKTALKIWLLRGQRGTVGKMLAFLAIHC